MSTDTETIDRIAPSRRPDGRAVGYQVWHDLTFLHWRVPADAIAPLIAPDLTIDTWDGDAWIGLVPFGMARVRPWWAPSVPGLSRFLETNVRTYVHVCGGRPGVWFFSLDAGNRVAVRVARALWNLNYFDAKLSLSRSSHGIEYRGRRAGSRSGLDAGYTLNINPDGNALAPAAARLGTLEHWLIERYYLYTTTPTGQLLRGQVHHRPYRLSPVRSVVCRESMLAANAIEVEGDPVHAVYCDGVDVEVFPLVRVEG